MVITTSFDKGDRNIDFILLFYFLFILSLLFDQGGVSGQLLIRRMVLGVERSGLGGECLADRHCSSFLACYLGAENVEAAGKS